MIPIKVLIVEDSEDDTFLLIRTLQKNGYEPLFKRVDTKSGLEQALQTEKWDVVISDFSLPEIQGLEALQIVQKSNLDVPFIIVSGVIGEETAVSAMRAGAQDFVMKNNLARFAPAVAREIKEFKVRTEQKAAKQALKVSQDIYKTIFESTGISMAIVNEDQTIVMINSETENLTGYSKKELEGKNWTFLIQSEDFDHVKGYIKTKTKDFGYAPHCEFRMISKEGAVRHIFLTVAKIPDSPRSIISFLDITKRKIVERALEKHIQELARSNAELRQFAYVASHDLQEPLRMISSYVQLLAKRYQGKLDSEADDFIRFIVDSTFHMKKLIEDLLAYSRISSKGREAKTINTKDSLKQALENLKKKIDDHQAKVIYNDLPLVTGDSVLLTQLFQNLIENAIKFRSTALPKIQISAEETAGEWIFAVQDNGIGIEPEYFDRIFEIFQRLHSRNIYPGTGIGLAICKKIVENLGGKIWVTSKVEEGSTFYFSLPK